MSKVFLYINGMISQESGESFKRGIQQSLQSWNSEIQMLSLDLNYGEHKSSPRWMGQVARNLGVDAVILSGSEHNTSDLSDPWVKEYYLGLEDLLNLPNDFADWSGPRFPIFGICFGHQALANVFGGETARFNYRSGFVDMQYSHQAYRHPLAKKWIKKFPNGLKLGVSHGDQIIRMPKGFHRLLSSDYCEVQGMSHDQWPIVSLQSHPEILREFQEISTEKEDWSRYTQKDFESQNGPEILHTIYEWMFTR